MKNNPKFAFKGFIPDSLSDYDRIQWMFVCTLKLFFFGIIIYNETMKSCLFL